MKYTPDKPLIYGETLESLRERLAAIGEKPFRATQIMDWLYKKRAGSPEDMTNLSKPLRAWLTDTFIFAPATPILDKRSGDVTDKLLLQLGDRSLIETV